MRQPAIILPLLLSLICGAGLSRPTPAPAAAPLRVAAAANFAGPLAGIIKIFQPAAGLQVDTTIASSGTLYAQIKSGAPFDIFLAADTVRPAKLAGEGKCREPFEYARGQVVLWSGEPAFRQHATWQAVIADASLQKIALANPAVAPYGAAVKPLLDELLTASQRAGRLVYGQNVAQAFQFAQSGAAGAAFTALSFARSAPGKAGRYWPIAAAAPVSQHGCLVTSSKQPAAARQFIEFMQSAAIKTLITNYGYY